MWFKVVKPAFVRQTENATSQKVGAAAIEDTGLLLEERDGLAFKKLLIRLAAGGFAEGWVAADRIKETNEPPRAELQLARFLKVCVSAETWLNSKPAAAPHFVLADYLIALASIESQTKNAGLLRKDSDGVGPFQIDSAEWRRFTDAEPDKIFDANDRDDYLDQCYGAAFLTHLDVKAISEAVGALGKDESGDAEKPGDVGPFVPSLSDVFLAHIVGSALAVEMRKRMIEGKGTDRVLDVLLLFQTGTDAEKAAAADALMRRRNDFLKVSADQSQSVAGMFERIDSRLASELKEAFKLMQENIPEDIPLPTGGAPWMALAEAEMAVWAGTGVSEGTAAGLAKVREYFAATDSGITRMEPWCGGFVAFCLQNAGVQPVAGGARAANWKKWGTVSLLGGNPDVPKGAVVVLTPTPGSQRSGHVGFFSRFLSVDEKPRVELLGGNQSDTVQLSVFPRARIADIRWHSDVTTQMMAAVSGATVADFGDLLDFIGKLESADNYEAYIGKSKNKDNPKLTVMSIGEIRTFQDKLILTHHESSAVGRYQIVGSTLTGLVNTLNIKLNEVFDQTMQDRLALQLLKERGIGSFRNGSKTAVQFGLSLAQEWASLPVLADTMRDGIKIKRGQSYYDGVGSNSALTTPEKVEAILQTISN